MPKQAGREINVIAWPGWRRVKQPDRQQMVCAACLSCKVKSQIPIVAAAQPMMKPAGADDLPELLALVNIIRSIQ